MSLILRSAGLKIIGCSYQTVEVAQMNENFTVLFAGPSGSGKTMAAKSLAEGLNAPLLKVELTAVVSKYIGETEKNLREVFREAEESGAIVFFDEADALFGKRKEVGDSHDRSANPEVEFLRKCTEKFSGLVIIASNSKKNIEDAFSERVKSVVEFSATDADRRDNQVERLRDLQELVSRKRR